MSLDVPDQLLAQAEHGEVPDADFVACVRDSLPYAWQVVSTLAGEITSTGAAVADHATPPPTEAHRGQLLRALASDAIRGALERHFGMKLAFQNCHRVAAFRLDATATDDYQAFISPRAQLLNQEPDLARLLTADAPPGDDRIRCGVFLLAGRFPGQDDGVALARAADAVVAAEAAGFDDAWIAEHHFMPYGTCPSAITFAAHAAGRTSRIGVGTAVSVLSTTHPVALAEQVALVDQLSGGRFSLGVGRGGPWVDLEVFGTGLGRYERGFAEGLDLLLRCLTQERVAATGERFAFREVPMVPRPRTRPHPPVAVACASPATIELAADRGLPMLLGLHIGDHDKAHMVAHYAKAARAAGRDPDTVQHIAAVLAHVADDRGQAHSELRAAMPGWLAEGLAAHVPIDGRARPTRDPAAYTEMLCSLHPIGSPQQCIDRLHTHTERTGIRHVIMLVEGTGDPARTLENITRLGHEVLPHLR